MGREMVRLKRGRRRDKKTASRQNEKRYREEGSRNAWGREGRSKTGIEKRVKRKNKGEKRKKKKKNKTESHLQKKNCWSQSVRYAGVSQSIERGICHLCFCPR